MALATLCAAASPRCGGDGGFGESVVVPQAKRTALDATLAEGRSLRFPDDQPFNVADAQRYSTGDARAESSADPAGKAACTAVAAAQGSAWAEFQLGQVMDHRGERPLEATVSFHVNYRYRMDVPAETPGAAANKFALKAYIQDSQKRVLKRVMLAELEPNKGPQSWDGRQSSAFDVTLEPGLAYHLILAGRVEVTGPDERRASAEIEVVSFELEVSARIATALQSSGSER